MARTFSMKRRLFVIRLNNFSMVNVGIYYLIMVFQFFVYLPPFVFFHKLFYTEELITAGQAMRLSR